MIEKISRLKHPGVLRDFTWPVDLSTFGRFNLIYGWNGSGKTTISRLFRYLEHRDVPPAGQGTLCVGGTDVDGSSFPQATTQVRVFNRDFINESVFPAGGGDVPPILVVGKEGVGKQKEVDRLRAEKSTRETDLSRARTANRQTERALHKHCTDRAKVIKDTLRIAGRGTYNEYDKRDYVRQAQKMAAAGDAESYRLDDSTRDNLLLQHRAIIKARVAGVDYVLPGIEQLRHEVASILAKPVSTSALRALKNDPQLGDWAREGLRLHKHRNAKVCLFCEQRLPPGRLDALEAHFSTAYEQFIQRVDEHIERLKATSDRSDDVRPPDRAALYDDMAAEYNDAREALEHALSKLRQFIDALIEALEAKRGQPFGKQELAVELPRIDAGVVDRVNNVIQCHNDACDDFQARTGTARNRLAFDIISQDLHEYSRLAAAAERASESLPPIEVELNRLSGEIARLEREIVEHRQPAEELNKDLWAYLGHDELRLEVKSTGYALMRHGTIASGLSEGERTALALLYFLKSLSDRRFDLTKGVVLLDDPVSSLDANALYLAFGFIRQRTKDAGQLFLLTHNFTLFRQARNWFHHLKGQNKKDINQRPARFYMLDRVREAQTRCTTIRRLDPLLEHYESEYHYLFACIHRRATPVPGETLEQNYDLPNIARRLLEMFLAFRRPQVAGKLRQKLMDIEFDEVKKLRILRFVHTYSHGDVISEPEHDATLLGEAQAVLADLLELIKSEDVKHYEAMMSLVDPPNDGETDQ